MSHNVHRGVAGGGGSSAALDHAVMKDAEEGKANAKGELGLDLEGSGSGTIKGHKAGEYT